MGAKHGIPQQELVDLMESTQYKKRYLKRWYKKFMKEYPEGKLDKEQFNEVFGNMYKTKANNNLVDHIFRSFDRDNDGFHCFKELMLGFSTASNGTMREKLEWLFNVYDIDGDGKITIDELSDVVKCMSDYRKEISNSELVDMFKEVDSNSDGYLVLEEFTEGWERNPAFVKMLQIVPSANR